MTLPAELLPRLPLSLNQSRKASSENPGQEQFAHTFQPAQSEAQPGPKPVLPPAELELEGVGFEPT
jgi:hypothetical protein